MASRDLGEADIVDLSERALVACGATVSNAHPLALSIAAAGWSGMPSHGLLYLPTYCEHPRVGKVAQVRAAAARRGTVPVDAALYAKIVELGRASPQTI